MRALFTSRSEQWYTPAWILRRVEQAIGPVDCDPCSNDGEPNVPARIHYTAADDGLSRSWNGTVFMNPPYGRNVAAWVNKLRAEYRLGHTTAAIALIHARTDTRWYALLADVPVAFLQGRVKFIGGLYSAPFPSALFYLGPDVQSFAQAFGDVAHIYIPQIAANRLAQTVMQLEAL